MTLDVLGAVDTEGVQQVAALRYGPECVRLH